MKNPYQQNERVKKIHNKMKIESRKINLLMLTVFLSSFLWFTLLSPAKVLALRQQDQASKPQAHFYNVDREVTIEGQVEDLRFDTRYEGKSHFLILMVRDKSSGELIEVETAPAWFFQTDIHKGESVKLVGSVVEENQGKKLMLAREIRINNRTIILRDRRGFPAWSRGRGRGKGFGD